ncbi:MAG TPA: hypothetical protein VJB90_00475 [Candidatus Nanoarchaeia archaeon]|nr:hypothetical protein [Candidatus Nanoarchaeia archaeon]
MESVPEKQFVARPIFVTIWRKGAEDRIAREISLSRRFKDKSGCWAATGNLRINDIPKVVMLLQDAYRYIALNPDIDEAFNAEDAANAGLIKLM